MALRVFSCMGNYKWQYKKTKKTKHASLSLLASSGFFPNDLPWCTEVTNVWPCSAERLNVSADWNCSPIIKTVLWPSLQDRSWKAEQYSVLGDIKCRSILDWNFQMWPFINPVPVLFFLFKHSKVISLKFNTYQILQICLSFDGYEREK